MALGAAEEIRDRVQNSQAAITGQRQRFPSLRCEIPFCECFGDNRSLVKYKIKFPFFQAETVFQIHQLCFPEVLQKGNTIWDFNYSSKSDSKFEKSQFSKGAFPLGSVSGINPREGVYQEKGR